MNNALFFGIENEVAPRVDVLLHGHGIDYVFPSMYLQQSSATLFGRPTFLN